MLTIPYLFPFLSIYVPELISVLSPLSLNSYDCSERFATLLSGGGARRLSGRLTVTPTLKFLYIITFSEVPVGDADDIVGGLAYILTAKSFSFEPSEVDGFSRLMTY